MKFLFFAQLITFENIAQILHRGSQIREKSLFYQNVQKYFHRLAVVPQLHALSCLAICQFFDF